MPVLWAVVASWYVSSRKRVDSNASSLVGGSGLIRVTKLCYVFTGVSSRVIMGLGFTLTML